MSPNSTKRISYYALITSIFRIVSNFACLTLAIANDVQDNVKTNHFRHRQLEDVNDDYQYDLSQYSVRFTKCQNVKMYDDEVAQSENMDTVFTMKHFVLFRLCSSDDCGSCNTNYGEYVLDVQDYLQATATYQKDAFEKMCDQCDDGCDDDGEDCVSSTSCGRECWKYENLNNFGYVDATDYVECQKLDLRKEDDDGNQKYEDDLYIGPRCSSDGSRVFIGLFYDEECSDPFKSASVEDVTGFKISYHLLKNTYSNNGEDCISCMENDYYNDGNDNNDADDVNEMCEQMYESSAKCESKNGITNGFIQINKDDNNFENQIENEFKVCSFIDSLIWDSYTETGEININAQRDFVYREVTTTQKLALITLSITIITSIAYAFHMQKIIEQNYPSTDLLTK